MSLATIKQWQGAKPHLLFHYPCYHTAPGWWICAGKEQVQTGETPAQAYANWEAAL